MSREGIGLVVECLIAKLKAGGSSHRPVKSTTKSEEGPTLSNTPFQLGSLVLEFLKISLACVI